MTDRYKVVVSDSIGKIVETYYFDVREDAENTYGSLKRNPNVYMVQFYDTAVYESEKKKTFH